MPRLATIAASDFDYGTCWLDGLGVRFLVVGDDFRFFGHGRAGRLRAARTLAGGGRFSSSRPPMHTLIDGVRPVRRASAAAGAAGEHAPRRPPARAPIQHQRPRHAWRQDRLHHRLSRPPTSSCTAARRCWASTPSAWMGTRRSPLPGVASVGVRPTINDAGRPMASKCICSTGTPTATTPTCASTSFAKQRDEERTTPSTPHRPDRPRRRAGRAISRTESRIHISWRRRPCPTPARP